MNRGGCRGVEVDDGVDPRLNDGEGAGLVVVARRADGEIRSAVRVDVADPGDRRTEFSACSLLRRADDTGRAVEAARRRRGVGHRARRGSADREVGSEGEQCEALRGIDVPGGGGDIAQQAARAGRARVGGSSTGRARVGFGAGLGRAPLRG